MKSANQFRLEDREIRKASVTTVLDSETLKENGLLSGTCPKCMQKYDVRLANVRLEESECTGGDQYIAWQCPHCGKSFVVFLFHSKENVRETIIEGLRKSK